MAPPIPRRRQESPPPSSTPWTAPSGPQDRALSWMSSWRWRAAPTSPLTVPATTFNTRRKKWWRKTLRSCRFRILMAALTVVLLAAIVMSAALGAARLSPGQVVPAALHRFLPQGGASQESSAFPNWAPGLLWGIRFPRIAMALVVGLALSTAGATFQGVFRNPLAEPYLLGVSAGAGLGATVAIVWKPLASLGIWTLPVAAFVGATLSAFMVYR